MDWSRGIVGAAVGLVSLVASFCCFWAAFLVLVLSASFFGEPSSIDPALGFGGILVVCVATPFILALPGLALGSGWLRSVGAGVLAGVLFLFFLFWGFAPVAGTTVAEGYLMPLMFVSLPALLSVAVVPGRSVSVVRSVGAIMAGAAALYVVSAGVFAAYLATQISLLSTLSIGVAAASWALLPAIAGATTRKSAGGR